MNNQDELSPRQRNILFAIVKEYCDTGECIGSKELREKYGFNFSPATIRNELSYLRKNGYLEQKYTNGPSQPTEDSLKIFVNRLIEGLEITTHQQTKLKSRVMELQSKQVEMNKEIARLVADQAGGIGFTLTKDGEDVKGMSNLLKYKEDGKVDDILNFLDNIDAHKQHFLPGEVVDEIMDLDEDMRKNKSNIKMIVGDDNPVIPLGKGYALISTEVEMEDGEKTVIGLITPTRLLAKKKNLQLLEALNRVLTIGE